jgi:hypothetical protein
LAIRRTGWVFRHTGTEEATLTMFVFGQQILRRSVVVRGKKIQSVVIPFVSYVHLFCAIVLN